VDRVIALTVSTVFCAWCAALGVASAQAPARTADGVMAFQWSAPQGCGTRAEVLARAQRHLDGPVVVRDTAALQMEGEIEEADGIYTLVMRTHAQAGSEEREFRSGQCAELTDAAALLIALMLQMRAPDEAEQPEDAMTARGVHPWLGPELVSDLGPLPVAAFGAGVRGGVALGRTTLALGFEYLPPVAVDLPARAMVAELGLLAASINACHAFWRVPALGPCLRAEYGRIFGHGRNVEDAGSGTAPFVVLAAGARLGVPIGRTLSLQSELSGGITLDRAEFAVAGIGRVHRIPAFVGRLQLGAFLHF
jgi:hypothetical protein